MDVRKNIENGFNCQKVLGCWEVSEEKHKTTGSVFFLILVDVKKFAKLWLWLELRVFRNLVNGG